jgi:hypothetical protein
MANGSSQMPGPNLTLNYMTARDIMPWDLLPPNLAWGYFSQISPSLLSFGQWRDLHYKKQANG